MKWDSESRSMRWVRAIQRRNRLARWHRWFAWYPVQVGEKKVWLEYVERRIDFDRLTGKTYYAESGEHVL